MSESEPHVFAAPLTACIDITNPHAYLAKDLVYRLEDELGLQVDWLPYLVPPLTPPSEPGESDDRGVRHRRHRARYVERDIQRYAAIRGLVLRDLYRQVDASVAAVALLWARRGPGLVLRRVMDQLFSGYWEGRLDVEDPEAVTRVLLEAGADIDGWQSYRGEPGRRELARLRTGLSAGGIFNVPAFVVNVVNTGENGGEGAAEIFYGRAHLPMIRWLLEGRTGPAPI